MENDVIKAIDACRADVESSPKFELSFPSRRRLLLALGPQKLDERGYGIELIVGKRRRTHLALSVSQKVSSFWKRDFGTSAIDDLLLLVERYLGGEVSISDVERKTDSLQGGLFNDPQGKDQAFLAGSAAAATGWVAVGDEVLSAAAGVSEEELDDPEDPDLWDPAFFAAGAWAGGMPWSPSFSSSAYREFWIWYLDQAVPQAWDAGG